MKNFTGPRGGVDAFGSAMNAETHRLNMAMSASFQTLQEVSDKSGIPNIERVRNHMRWLVNNELAEKRDKTWPLNRHGLRLWYGDPPALPEEVSPSAHLVEGAAHQILVNAYERCPEARRQCIDHYGYECRCCGFDFGKTYGPVADQFIHVHHLKPLSEIGEEYRINPIKDLRPVCPNCHAVIHLGGECYTIEAVQQLLQAARRH